MNDESSRSHSIVQARPTARHESFADAFHGDGAAPKWMVSEMEHPNLTWMMTGGTPILGNPHLVFNARERLGGMISDDISPTGLVGDKHGGDVPDSDPLAIILVGHTWFGCQLFSVFSVAGENYQRMGSQNAS